jgi:hypothetical protein
MELRPGIVSIGEGIQYYYEKANIEQAHSGLAAMN